jgi:hypothetical protein
LMTTQSQGTPSMSWSEAIRCSISSISIENSSQAGTFARESFKFSVGLVHVFMHFASNSNPETTVSGRIESRRCKAFDSQTAP